MRRAHQCRTGLSQHGLIGDNRTEVPHAGRHTASTIAHPQRHAVGRQPPGFAPSLHCGGTRGVAREPDAAMQRALVGLQCTRKQIHGAGQVAACPAPICWSLRESGGASRNRGPGARPRRQPGSPLTMRKSSLFRGRSLRLVEVGYICKASSTLWHCPTANPCRKNPQTV